MPEVVPKDVLITTVLCDLAMAASNILMENVRLVAIALLVDQPRITGS